VFNIGGPELLVILLVALLVLGPNKLPEAARQVGRAMHELRRLSNGFQDELRQALEDPSDKPASRRSVVTGNQAAPPPANGRGAGNGSRQSKPVASGAGDDGSAAAADNGAGAPSDAGEAAGEPGEAAGDPGEAAGQAGSA
jgi:Tat protein translocase TatB subunit